MKGIAQSCDVGRRTKMLAGGSRVVFVLPSLIRAGAETQAVSLINGLDADLFDRHLFVFERQLDQLDRVELPTEKIHHVSRSGKYDLAPAASLARLIDDERIDTVHCTLQIALFVGWLAIRRSRRRPKLVVALHTTKNRSRRDDAFDFMLYQWLMRDCSQVICVCKEQETHWQKRFPFLRGRTQVIYNGIDVNWFNPRTWIGDAERFRTAHRISPSTFVSCCIAAFRPEKGHHLLLRAFQLAKKLQPNMHLFLAGDGPERRKLEDIARQLDIVSGVTFLGNIVDVRPVLAASNVSILASTAVETFSMAMLESLSMEVPMIATNIGGTKEAIVTGQTGYLVPPGEVDALSGALVRLASNQSETKLMGRNGRRMVIERFTDQRMISETASLLLDSGTSR